MNALDAIFRLLGHQVSVTRRFAWNGGRVAKWTYFNDEETKGLDTELCAMLDRARGLAGVPFIITSGFRATDQNAALVEAVRDSAHLTGNAVDISCNDSSHRYNMLRGLILAGFNRIGIYSQHIHADNSPKLPSNVIWYVQGT